MTCKFFFSLYKYNIGLHSKRFLTISQTIKTNKIYNSVSMIIMLAFDIRIIVHFLTGWVL